MTLATLIAVGELLTRAYLTLKGRSSFFARYPSPVPKVLSFQEHPYALYVKRKNAGGLYPSNSMGYGGKRELVEPRPKNSLRIYCVGGSTTEEHDPTGGPDSSWPGKLQDILSGRYPMLSVECINAAVPGYTSAESLAEFVFRGIDLRPDILVVYHNVNDAWTCQMLEDFRSDYSHARKHKTWERNWASRLPQVQWLATYQLARTRIAERWGKANALLFWIAAPPWRAASALDPKAVEAFRRNVHTLAGVAEAWGCTPVILRWECDWSAEGTYVPPYFGGDRSHLSTLYFEYLRANNAALLSVAASSPSRQFADVGPFSPSDFRDTMHFSSQGLQKMAERVATALDPLIRSKLQRMPAVAGETTHAASWRD